MLRYRRHVQSFTAVEIAAKLEIAEKLRGEGKRVYEIARILGVTDTTYYNWLKRAAKPTPSGESELRRLRRENAQLKRAVKSLAGLAGSEPTRAASETTHDRLSV
jgi:transposase-like protein